MSENYTCPQDGCDFGESEDKSLASVRGHITSASGHDWDELKADLYAQAEDTDASDEESDDDAAVEADVDDLAEAAQDDAQDDDEDSDEDDEDMASQDEYQEQYSDDGDQGDDQGDGDAPDTTDDADGMNLPIPAISASTAMLILGGLAVAYVAWRMLGSDAASDHTPAEESDDVETSTAVVDTDAGTGGVEL